MSRSWWAKFTFLILVILGAASLVYPSLTQMDLENSSYPIKKKVNLGLDLQGGLYLVLGVDFNDVYHDVILRQGSSAESRMKEKSIGVLSYKKVDSATVEDPRVSFLFQNQSQVSLAKDLLKQEYSTLRLTKESDTELEYGLSTQYRTDTRDKTISQSVEVIRNRIDEFGVTEPSITTQGESRVVVELPGVKDIDRAKALIGRTAKLEFHLVDDESKSFSDLVQLIEKIEKDNNVKYDSKEVKFSDYAKTINEKAKGQIPENRFIAFERPKNEFGEVDENAPRIPYLLHSVAAVTGEDLEDASPAFDEMQKPLVSFSLNPKGAEAFAKLTGDNVGKRISIVLDGIVHSAPVVNSKIYNRGQITLGTGNRDKIIKEANDLAVVLRAGALPAELSFLEQRVVGPSLGQDSIQKGATAGLIGALLILVLMSVYYRTSGMIAAVSLVLNIIFVVACLVMLGATLTLPGIAGIGLTVGIAVDSNIVIFERIREELRSGKNILSAVEAGFDKAIRTILDANVTNAAGALVLFVYGTGPIKGFAVTLLIGIITTLFTAVFVCRVLFDLYLASKQKSKKLETLSI